MALLLSSRGLLAKIHHTAESNPAARTGLLTAASMAVGVAAGKLADPKKVPLGAIAAGAVLSYAGFTAIGDGSVAAGTTLVGYRWAARREAKKRALAVAAAAPVTPPKKKG